MESSFSESVTTAIAAMKSSFKLIGVNTERPPGSRGRLRNFTLQTLGAFINSLFPNGVLTTVVVENTETPDGVAHITGQVTDESGNALSGRYIVEFYVAESLAGALSDEGTASAAAGTVLLSTGTDAGRVKVMTDDDGTWGVNLDLVADDEIFVHASVHGKVTTDSASITGN